MTDTLLADASEFQADIDADAYIRGGHGVLVCRTHNGNRADRKMPERATYLRGKPFVALGWYQYLVPDVDPATQARQFIATVGNLRQNEFPVLDLEKGRGNQTPRAEAWFKVVDQWAGFQASLYSGSAFFRYQLNTTAHWGQRPLWIASYPNDYQVHPQLEPGGADWWQYSDRSHFPGISGPCDASIFHGTAQQFLARVRPGVTPTPTPPEGAMAIHAVVKQNGAIELFCEVEAGPKKGEVFHTWQNGPNTSWWGAEAGKQNAKWQTLGNPSK